MLVKTFQMSSNEWRAQDSILVLVDEVGEVEELVAILEVEEEGVGICQEEEEVVVGAVEEEEGVGSAEVAFEQPNIETSQHMTAILF